MSQIECFEEVLLDKKSVRDQIEDPSFTKKKQSYRTIDEKLYLYHQNTEKPKLKENEKIHLENSRFIDGFLYRKYKIMEEKVKMFTGKVKEGKEENVLKMIEKEEITKVEDSEKAEDLFEFETTIESKFWKVIHPAERVDFIHDLHYETCAGRDVIELKLKELGVHWYGIRDDIMNVLEQCPVCSKCKSGNNRYVEEKVILAKDVYGLFEMDITYFIEDPVTHDKMVEY